MKEEGVGRGKRQVCYSPGVAPDPSLNAKVEVKHGLFAKFPLEVQLRAMELLEERLARRVQIVMDTWYIEHLLRRAKFLLPLEKVLGRKVPDHDPLNHEAPDDEGEREQS